MEAGKTAAILLFMAHGYRMVTAILNAFFPNKKTPTRDSSWPKVSLLLPLRNEMAQLPAWGAMLPTLMPLLHELIVYDDQSTDGTADWIEIHWQNMPKLKLLKGDSLPAGWYGKHHACHQLALQASGEYLLFVDADVRVDVAFFQKMVQLAASQRLQLLSVFPQQQYGGWSEALWVSLLSHSLLSGIWLPLVQKIHLWQIAAANGQFMLFEAAAYHQNQWHAGARQLLTDDLAIARAVKRAGYTMAVCQASEGLYCRMYGSGMAALAGISRNVVPAMGGWGWASLFLLANAAAWGLVLWDYPQSLPFLCAILLLTRIFVLQASAESVPQQIGLWSVQLFAWPYLWCYGIYAHLTRRIRWKDRPVK